MYFYVGFTVLIALAGRHRDAVIPVAFVAVLAWTLYSYFVRLAYEPETFALLSQYEIYWASPYLLQFLAGAMLAGWLRRRPTGPA